jgi:sec-independent protein translocase protein TatA
MLVFGIVLLLFGGKRLPGIATGLGSAIKSFKQAMNEPEVEPKRLENANT